VRTIDGVSGEHRATGPDLPGSAAVTTRDGATVLLLDGEIDAAVVGDKLPDPRLEHLIPDHEAAARKWAERHGGVPINHMVVVRERLSRERPDAVREVFRGLLESKRAAGLPEGAVDPYRFGVAACRPVLEVIIDFCWRQQLLPRRLTVDELFDETTAALTR
jgi:4,5-dihydroxyphthalate decarboxylase